MAKESNIGWTDATKNFWIGCKKVSEGCKFCYMYRDLNRFKQFDPQGYHRVSDKTFYEALKWKTPKRIFTCSWSDFFLEAADKDRADAWKVIKDTPQHTWIILTKRPERIKECLPSDWGNGYENVWLGVTVENQFRLMERVPYLAEIPARVKFLSIEPILSEINILDENFKEYINDIDWFIIGGESGNKTGKHRYRPSELNWYISLSVQAKSLGKPVFVKQLGAHLAKEMGFKDGKGETFDLLPKSLQLREFPKPKTDRQLKFIW